MKTILALDTSTDACSVALWYKNECIEEFAVAPRQHAQLILQQIDRVLLKANLSLNELEAIAFGRGPGSFTGIRIACSVAQGLALGADLPLLPISTLRALAQAIPREMKQCVPLFFARLNEVYWGSYTRDEQGLMQSVVEDQLSVIDHVQYPVDSFAGVGDGWTIFQRQEGMRPAHAVHYDAGLNYPHAREIGFLALYEPLIKHGAPESIEAFLPAYLRSEVANVRK